MTREHGAYRLDDDRSNLDLRTVHEWLTSSYWNRGCSLEHVERATTGASLVVGAYLAGQQVGFMRVVSDRVTFAWLSDVIVAEDHRGKGIAKAMVRFALDHPDYKDMKRWVLATKDAHSLYEELGFKPLPNPDDWLILGKSKLD